MTMQTSKSCLKHTAVLCLTASLKEYGLSLGSKMLPLRLSKEEDGPGHLHGWVILAPLGFASHSCALQDQASTA